MEVCGPVIASEADVIRSVYYDQREIIRGIIKLHAPCGIECDVTYGNGNFWRDITPPPYKFDIDPQVEGVEQSCSTSLPLADASMGSLMFDPPFLTYVRAAREGNGSMKMARRFGGYWRYEELVEHYTGTIIEAARVLKKGGVMVVKCQDIIHNHKMHCTHASVIGWAADSGMRLLDLFVLPARHRLPAPNRAGTQKHARSFHSYFLVFKKV